MDYFSAVLALGGFFLFLVMAILIALYVVESLALYTLAKNNGQDSNAILAWVLAGDQDIFGNRVQGMILGVLMIIFPILTIFVHGFLFYIVGLCGIVVAYFTLNGLYKKMEGSGDQSVIAVISAIIPLVRIIYVFMHRNDTLTEEGQIVE